MADTDDKKKKEDPKAEKDEQSRQAGTKKISILTWIIMAVVVVLLAGSGFVLGRLFAGTDKPQTQSSQIDKVVSPREPETENSQKDSQGSWYYDLEPVVANLDEPGVTRYVRASLKLEISSGLNEEKGKALLEEKKPILTNWLTIYLAGLTVEDARGDRNLKRIQSQILDAFNETLFPDAKPQIEHILFNEFVVN